MIPKWGVALVLGDYLTVFFSSERKIFLLQSVLQKMVAVYTRNRGSNEDYPVAIPTSCQVKLCIIEKISNIKGRIPVRM